jgi:CHAT domain-containing protein
LSTLLRWRGKRKLIPAERLLSVGNPRFNQQAHPELPDLPGAAQEAAAVAALYQPHRLLVGAQADKETVLRELNQADVVHLALHHLPDRLAPLRSKLVLAALPNASGAASTDDVLPAAEIYRQPLSRPRLVVLSACQTGVSTYYGGEGALGLARPFEAAGIPLIVASLWPVDSPATTKLMIRFHQVRKRDGLTAAALRAAQLALLTDAKELYRHPYYWAAFAVIGGSSEF